MIEIHDDVQGVATNSATCQKTDIFVAIPCARIKENCQEAYQKGVRHFALEEAIDLPSDATIYHIESARLCAAQCAAHFYPQMPQYIAAVTGTNGKSSTVSLLRQIWTLSHRTAASLGTLGLEAPVDCPFDIPSLTSFDPITFHKILSYLSQQNINAVAIEASSHGLDQYRIDGAPLSVAAFTNLTQDHLDYHHTMENYFAAKAKLFTRVLKPKMPAVINKDSPYFDALKLMIHERDQTLITFSKNTHADFMVTRYEFNQFGMTLDLDFKGVERENVRFPFYGIFQIENMLCAAAMAYATGITIEQILDSIAHLKPIKGRMEYVGDYKGASVFVDYAHTPDALENILKSIRHHTGGKIHLVFGCGGDRDKTKRPLMGEIANKLADIVYVTDDNPRSENPSDIRSQILNTVSKAYDIADRQKAIETAITHLNAADVLIVAGKGHETGQTYNGTIYPFSDQEEIRKMMHNGSIDFEKKIMHS
ncbi:MAG: UDP-N-acetylmuramoyl-L-alanyl-D-glutamate--2,6-diaminopimelate ligase [Holosporales bacterium]